MALPAGIGTGLLTANIFGIIGDTAIDPDRNPDASEIDGIKLFIKADLEAIGYPQLLKIGIPIAEEFSFNENYDLVDKTGEVGVRLVATDTQGSSQNWTYTVVLSFDSKYGLSPIRWTFQVPTGSTVDLSTVVPESASAGQLTIMGVGVAPGGTTGQVLTKNSDADYDTEWATSSGGEGGGSWSPDYLFDTTEDAEQAFANDLIQSGEIIGIINP